MHDLVVQLRLGIDERRADGKDMGSFRPPPRNQMSRPPQPNVFFPRKKLLIIGLDCL